MEETKTNASAHLVRYRCKIREGSPEGTRKTMEERICDVLRLLIKLETSKILLIIQKQK